MPPPIMAAGMVVICSPLTVTVPPEPPMVSAFSVTVPFWMVMDGSASHAVVLGTVVAMAVVQIFVHLVYFLHMNTSSEARWNLVALVFTVLIIAIVVVGSLWIMYNLNINMMVH